MIDFDPTSAAFAADPWSVYAALREAGPVRHEGLGMWLLARAADVDAVARDERCVRGLEAFRSADEIAEARRARGWDDMPDHERFVQTNLLESDGATHRRLRLVVMRALTRAMVARHAPVITAHVDALLDPCLEAGTFDFVADLAAQIPGHVIGHVLGVPEADRPRLRFWSEEVVRFFDVGRTADDKLRAERATHAFRVYLEGLVAERRRTPRDDLLTTLVDAERAGELDETELIATAMLVLMAGHGSTIDLLGTGLHALLGHPDELARLRGDPALMPGAVQEMIRYESPLPFFHRHASTAMTLGGRRFAAGETFGLLYGAANRDPMAFPDPDRFDVGRAPNRHLSFGRGAHLCLGNHLSRLDAEIVFRRLLDRARVIEPVGGPPVYRRGLSTRGLEALPVTVTPR